MKRGKFLKQILGVLVVGAILLFVNVGEVKAVLQANKNTKNKPKANNAINWIRDIRKMEETGGAMGLNEMLNSDLTVASESNNIDVHMMKSTEYGAIAILSASGYGNPNNDINTAVTVDNNTTTTGNNTGIFIRGYIPVAAGNNKTFPNINKIYYDEYTDDYNSVKVGDALGNATTNNPGCAGWHSTYIGNWFGENRNIIGRAYEGIFGFSVGTVDYWSTGAGFGVVVCGVGL